MSQKGYVRLSRTRLVSHVASAGHSHPPSRGTPSRQDPRPEASDSSSGRTVRCSAPGKPRACGRCNERPACRSRPGSIAEPSQANVRRLPPRCRRRRQASYRSHFLRQGSEGIVGGTRHLRHPVGPDRRRPHGMVGFWCPRGVALRLRGRQLGGCHPGGHARRHSRAWGHPGGARDHADQDVLREGALQTAYSVASLAARPDAARNGQLALDRRRSQDRRANVGHGHDRRA